MDEKKEIIDRINRISGKYSAYEVFTDWIRCCALAMCNSVTLIHGSVYEKREKNYMDTISRYSREEAELFVEMLALLAMALEKNMEDVLGSIYMLSGMGNKASGQFFTPYHVSRLCAECFVPDPDDSGRYNICLLYTSDAADE